MNRHVQKVWAEMSIITNYLVTSRNERWPYQIATEISKEESLGQGECMVVEEIDEYQLQPQIN